MNLRAATTPQELYDALPKPQPLGQYKFLHAIEGTVGAYSFDYADYIALPEFDWQHMYNLTAALPQSTLQALPQRQQS
jgi:hypothetical protein